MSFLKKLSKGLLITGAVAGISTLAIKNRIEAKKSEEEAEEEYEKWQREFEERIAENEKRKSIICEFDDILDEEMFNNIVNICSKRIKRIERI